MSLFTAKEIAQYSVTKTLSELSDSNERGIDGQVSGLEREVHDTLSSHLKNLTGSLPMGFLLPIAALNPIGKALNVSTATAGGFLVGETLAGIAPALRASSVVIAMGARIFDNLRSDLGLPVESTSQTAEWLEELEALQGSDAVYGETLLSPRRVVSMATLSRQLLAQNSVGVENFVRDSLSRTIGVAIDKGALSGNGLKEPLGILNTNGTSTVTFGASATRSKTISFQDALATANAGTEPDASLGYITSPAVASKWMQIQEAASFSQWLWQGNEWQGTVAGLPARSSNNIVGNKVVCANWRNLAVAVWGESISILADPFAQKKSGLVEIVATSFVDTGPINLSNFCISTDSGAQ